MLTGDVKDYEKLFGILKDISPAPISFENIKGAANGFYHNSEKKIVIRPGLIAYLSFHLLPYKKGHKESTYLPIDAL